MKIDALIYMISLTSVELGTLSECFVSVWRNLVHVTGDGERKSRMEEVIVSTKHSQRWQRKIVSTPWRRGGGRRRRYVEQNRCS